MGLPQGPDADRLHQESGYYSTAAEKMGIGPISVKWGQSPFSPAPMAGKGAV